MSDATVERTAMVVVRIWAAEGEHAFVARVSTTCDAAQEPQAVTTVHSEEELRLLVGAWVEDILDGREPRR